MGLTVLPAPPLLGAWVMGWSVWQVESGADAELPLPAHALATAGRVLRGCVESPAGHAVAGDWITSGPATQAVCLRAEPGTEVVSVLCRASLLPQVTGMPASCFTDRPVPLAAFGLEGVEAGEQAPSDAWIGAMGAALVRRLADHPPRAATLRFARAMRDWDGARAQPPGWSARSWQRACRVETGLRPKQLQRLFRLHDSVRLWSPDAAGAVQPPASWAGLAVDAGFFDQSHWWRECRALAGVLPSRDLAGDRVDRLAALRLGAGILAPRWRSG